MNADPILRYDEEHNVYNDVSAERRRDSMRVLTEFQEHAGKPILEAGGPEMKSYLATLVEQGKAVGTVRKHANLIRPFYTWAWESKLVDAETFMGVKMVRAPRGAGRAARGIPRPYSRDEVKAMWKDVDRKYPWLPDDYYLNRFANGISRFPRIAKHAWRLQIEAIVALGLFGGLRLSEIYRATEVDIHPENAYVVVRSVAKNPDADADRTRIVPWTTPDMKRMIADWLAFRAWLQPDHDFVWLSLYQERHYKKPMRFRKFEMLMHDLGRGWEFHRLRHTALTEMLRAGYPLHEVQRIAGHSRLEQTLAYAELLPDDLIKTAARQQDKLSSALSPREREAA